MTRLALRAALGLAVSGCGGGNRCPGDGGTASPGCFGEGSATEGSGPATTEGTTTAPGGAGSTTVGDASEVGSGGEDTGDPIFDTRPEADLPPEPVCHVVDDMDSVGACKDIGPPDSFEPEVQWVWTGAEEPYSIVTPLVANLTDDNGDGNIDLCDVPDVVVVAAAAIAGLAGAPGHIYILDGATGEEHTRFDVEVEASATPALGDLDGDGVPEVIAVARDRSLVGFDREGTVLFEAEPPWPIDSWGGTFGMALALADVDNDADVEIIGGNLILDHEGQLEVQAAEPPGTWSATTVADLDGDGDQELVLGHAAYQHTGEEVFVTDLLPGYPQVADLDDDGDPEVLLTNENGISLLEADGTVVFSDLRPTGAEPNFTTWKRPATVHDFDGGDDTEFAMSSQLFYSVYHGDGTVLWSADVRDESGIATGTAFDFLGDGVAEAMYADEVELFVFDGATGEARLQTPRSSATLTEYPVVADVDDDGSAEIIVVSNRHDDLAHPTVQVIRDRDDRWIQARRIWNQHTYHVTNVREDGTIPQHEPPSWESLNTFRTNAQIEAGKICDPEPAG